MAAQSPRSLQVAIQRRLVAGLSSITILGAGAVWAGPQSITPPVMASSVSPFLSCPTPASSATLYVNSTVEPSAVVNPTNPAHIVIGYQQDRWSDGGARGLMAAISFDAGTTWLQTVIPDITVCSGGTTANGGAFERATDPWVSFAPNGDLYFFSMAFDATLPAGREGGSGKSAMVVSKSINGGVSWSAPVKLIEDTNPRYLNDKNTLTADPGDSQLVYAVWDRLQIPVGFAINPELVYGIGFKGPAMFARTVDGGATWEPARKIYDPGATSQTIGNQIVVLPDGTLLDFFDEIVGFRNDEGGSQFEFNLSLIRSTDKGVTWTHGPAIRAAKMMSMAQRRASGVIDPDPAPGAETNVRTADLLASVAVDRGLTSPRRGHVYAVWQDARFSGFTHDEIAFARSTDGGFTWSTPIKINQTPANLSTGRRQAFTPTVSVAADGTIAVSYFDFRNHLLGSGELSTDHWIVHCHPTSTVSCTASADWVYEGHVAGPFDMRQAPISRGYFLGDYMALPGIANRFKPVFVMSGPTAGRSSVFAADASEP